MPIVTPRLILRSATLIDFKASHQLLSDPEVMHFSLKGPYSEQQTADFIQDCIQKTQKNQPTLLAVIDRETEQLIGYCGFYMQKINGVEEVELGYRLSKQHWGKGLATEAAIAMQKYAFDEMGLTRLISIIDTNNLASIRVAEKVGLILEKKMRYDRRLNVAIYAINA
jgi:ribosomal-protein-alanine N-acetyltransferase